MASGRAEHGGTGSEEELSGTSKTSTNKVSNPVEPLVVPATRKKRRAEGASRVESTTRDGATDESEETKSEADSNRGKTGLGVTGGGIDGELLALARLATSLTRRGRLDGIESRSEDDVDENIGQDELHDEHLAKRHVVGTSQGNESRGRFSRSVGREDDPQQENSQSSTGKLSSNVAEALEDGGLTSNDGSESDGRIEVGSRNIGERVDKGDRRETAAKSSDDRVDNGRISLGTLKVQAVTEVDKDEESSAQQLTQDGL